MTRALTTILLPLLALAGAGSCSGAEAGAAPAEVTVYAATSLCDVLEELAPLLEARTGVRPIFNFGSSGDLARQIVAGNQADLFLSADEAEMERVEGAGLLEPGTRRAWLSNRLVVIESVDPAGSGASCLPVPFTFQALARADVEMLALADPETVPAGKYAKALLQSNGLWAEVAHKIVPCIDVRAALAAVESGGARVGVVYRSDALRSTRVRVVYTVPPGEGARITYSLALLADRARGDRARGVADFLTSTEARGAYERSGFLVPGE